MSFLGEALPVHKQADGFSPCGNKDLIVEMLYFNNCDLYSKKDHRTDLQQMTVGDQLDDKGRPIWCEMWSCCTTDVSHPPYRLFECAPGAELALKRLELSNTGMHRYAYIHDTADWEPASTHDLTVHVTVRSCRICWSCGQCHHR